MPSSKQDQDFAGMMSGEIDEVKIAKTALDTAIEWIRSSLEPGDVFDNKALDAWAEANGYKQD